MSPKQGVNTVCRCSWIVTENKPTPYAKDGVLFQAIVVVVRKMAGVPIAYLMQYGAGRY